MSAAPGCWPLLRPPLTRRRPAARGPTPPQDMPHCLSPSEVVNALGLPELRGRRWQVQASVAVQGQGLYEGLDWLAQTLRK